MACLPVSLALATGCAADGNDGSAPENVDMGGQAGEGNSSGGMDSGSGGKASGTGGKASGTGGKNAGTGGKGSGGSGSGGSGGAGSGGSDSGTDSDSDGTPNASDNCPELSNENQEDTDKDGVGDACDVDLDNDGLIEVSSLEQLDWMRYSPEGRSRNDGTLAEGVEGDDTGCPSNLCDGYELTTDLDFDTNESGTADPGDAFFDPDGDSSNRGWTPMALSSTFEGNGHHIKNLYINRGDLNLEDTSVVGFFSTISVPSDGIAGVRNLTFDGPLTKVVGEEHVGIVAGRILVAQSQQAMLENVRAVGEVEASGKNAGGLVGSASAQNTGVDQGGFIGINSSSFQGKVTGSDATGGLVGLIQSNRAGFTLIDGSFAEADVLSTSSSATDGTGGLVGIARTFDASNVGQFATAQFMSSYALGTVESKGGCAGGLTGKMDAQYGTIALSQSFTLSSVKAASTAAGMVGCARRTPVSMPPEIIEVLALGKVTGGASGAGAVVAHVDGDLITWQNHWATDTTGLSKGAPLMDIDDSFGAKLSELACPTAPDDEACVASKTLFDGWRTSAWSFGTADELPGLLINGVVHRPTYDAGTSQFSVTTTALP